MASTSKAFNNFLFSAVLAASVAAVVAAGFQFEVGEKEGGNYQLVMSQRPIMNGLPRTDFKYEKDSVLVVNSADYLNCNTSNPISKFEDGNTVFQFDRSGLFYFISGQPGHCRSGQRLIIRVMHPSKPQDSHHLPPLADIAAGIRASGAHQARIPPRGSLLFPAS
ncbi:hypothetical protein DH2020_008725 [Rehmannia glutinosa]|uniref:Phytocyanin domain-containing protein n=1 Tax=Rehmannia glutinosa TaxID=99300 RepID=A0ABR0X486_REHGL